MKISHQSSVPHSTPSHSLTLPNPCFPTKPVAQTEMADGLMESPNIQNKPMPREEDSSQQMVALTPKATVITAREMPEDTASKRRSSRCRDNKNLLCCV